MFAYLWPGKDSLDETVATHAGLMSLVPRLLAMARGKGGEEVADAMARQASMQAKIESRLRPDEE